MAKVGDRVSYYFLVSAGQKLMSCLATVIKVWPSDPFAPPGEVADLELEISDEDSVEWGVGKVQTYRVRAGRPISGTWVK